MRVYHGSVMEISHPLVSVGRDNLDFGKGFYVTDIKSQAENWGMRLARRNLQHAIINVFDLDDDIFLSRYRLFPFYDEEWLDFIVENRQGIHASADFDVIQGGVANDRVIDSIEAYMSGFMPKSLCLHRLAEHQPNNQICILNQELADKYLHFVKSYQVMDYVE